MKTDNLLKLSQATPKEENRRMCHVSVCCAQQLQANCDQKDKGCGKISSSFFNPRLYPYPHISEGYS